MSSIPPTFPQFFFLGDRMQWTTRRCMNNLVHPTRVLSLEEPSLAFAIAEKLGWRKPRVGVALGVFLGVDARLLSDPPLSVRVLILIFRGGIFRFHVGRNRMIWPFTSFQ